MASKTKDTEPEPAEAPFSRPFRTGQLTRGAHTSFDLHPGVEECADIARFMQIVAVENLRMKGKLRPVGEDDWLVEARLTARVTQRCVVSLAPVAQDINEPVRRLYVPASGLPSEDEIDLELDEEDQDSYEDRIDVGHLMTEALALALDPYPRADDAALNQTQFAPPGVEPITDDSLKPFAKLAALKDKLSGEGG